MRCPTCGTENSPEAQFCTSCGVPLEAPRGEGRAPVYCTSCGKENPGEAGFCRDCGNPLQALSERPGASGTGPAYQVPGAATGELKPRDLGDLVSETFRVYRQRFWVFYLIALIAQIPFLAGQLIPGLVLPFILFFVGLAFISLAEGTTISEVAFLYLGKRTTVGGSFGRALSSLPSLIGSWVILLVAVGVCFATFIGTPLALYLMVSWFFVIQAITLEGSRGPSEALGRSHRLVKGSWWRVFGIGVVFVIMWIILELVALIPALIAGHFSPTAGSIVSAIFSNAVSPIIYIGATLVYFDLRVRKEGYTLETMAAEIGM